MFNNSNNDSALWSPQVEFVRLSKLADLIIIMYVAIPPSHRRGEILEVFWGDERGQT